MTELRAADDLHRAVDLPNPLIRKEQRRVN